MKNFITTQNWSRSELQDIVDFAIELKNKPHQPLLKNKSIAMLFFNPSLRTKTSFEVGISELSGTAIILQPGKDAWPIEFEENIKPGWITKKKNLVTNTSFYSSIVLPKKHNHVEIIFKDLKIVYNDPRRLVFFK